MRTNIDIDDTLLRQAMKFSKAKSKKAVVDEALRIYVKLSQQKSILELKGKICWEGDLDEMRS
ncbi:type II toxin-antitoxin system VapB family antitoxin [Tunicatimonas pelagia]|uniref:type II toxin-antitoxin system VapB family antitoxin n=1 Tax=Tunicatimonas pelagia TaxID=931531 RepID=UPI0026651FAE|nr:type II toxin-antitoxin system VapB family antitoxin [Tunicatimonas pelagia]WKN41169.1 type II toxin-antitoxin system VapB family antitoxin [Tunicatimonas pelagia]